MQWNAMLGQGWSALGVPIRGADIVWTEGIYQRNFPEKMLSILRPQP